MIFQTAVRKYLGIFFHTDSNKKKEKKFWTKNAENFHNVLKSFEIFTISRMKTRT
jgi:hypothetical protein